MKTIITLIALAGLLFAFPARAWQKGTFGAFIKELEGSPVKKRRALVEGYLAKTKAIPLVEGKETVHFVWYGKADTVKIEGELQKSWTTPETLAKIECGDRDFFHISYTLPPDALLEYRFLADGRRVLDGQNPQVIQSFDYGDRNIFGMPGFVPSPYTRMRPDIDKGTTSRLVFKTDQAPFSDHLVWVYTPYGYSESKKYPVLYVYDGMWALYDRPFVNALDNLIADKKIEPVVVVFVSFEDRWNEYVSHSTEYAQLVVDKLVPFIEGEFSVSTSPDKRGIMGASASGHGAMVTALRHPDVFGNVAAQGGGAGGTPGLSEGANAALDVYLTRKDQHPLRRLYTEVGTFDLNFPDRKLTFIGGARQFRDRLKEHRIDHAYREVSGGHNGTCWDQSLDKILVSFFGTPEYTAK
jgi:enterochelin esterase-like enzyme